jgi:hypothetical protein
MTLRTNSPFTLVAALCLMTACSSADDETVPVTDTASDTASAEVVDETMAIDSTIDSGAEDTMDSAVEDSSTPKDGETEASADAPSSETADAPSGDTRDGSTSCTSGAVEEEACGKCGKRSRLCDMSKWLDWGTCGEEIGICTPGDTRDVACERCGTRKETCSSMCEWGGGACTDQKACVAGATETRYSCGGDAGTDAGSDAGVQTRACSETCTWTDWSACP